MDELRKRVAEIREGHLAGYSTEPVTVLLDYIARLEAVVRAADEMEKAVSTSQTDRMEDWVGMMIAARDNYRKARDGE